MIVKVELSNVVLKRMRKTPEHIGLKLLAWVAAVEKNGLDEVRKIPGYNDHPLKGHLAGRRAIRLSQKWRAVYVVQDDGSIEFVLVEEVHPHDY